MKIGEVLRQLVNHNHLSSDDTSVIVYDLNHIKQRILLLKKVFSTNAIHCAAVKANPLINILKQMNELGTGAEVASLGELFIASKVKFPKQKIVFDSPAKTLTELEVALKAGVAVNADSFMELERIDSILKKIKSKSRIGVRINPQVGNGKIKITSVGGNYSKFGVPIKQYKNKLVQAFVKYPWLTGVHVHTGSQGCSVKLLLKGLKTVYDFAEEVNSEFNKKRIEFFDMGGGFPVSYSKEIKPLSMAEYASQIKKNLPKLFDGSYLLVTEFGRWIFANSAFTASRVEYVKRDEKINTAMIHVGADLFIRRTYHPRDWHHEFSVYNIEGKLKKGVDANKYVIAGPLCFAGDVLAKEISLPIINEGDWFVIHDTGAYTLSMVSRYNSRQIPKVVALDGEEVKLIKERETTSSIYKFWS